MEEIAVVGLSWRQGGPQALARFTLPAAERRERVRALAEELEARELVYLATCNRVDIALAASEAGRAPTLRRRVFRALLGCEPAPGEAERALRAWAGEGAVEHLFLVACGLDSARVGETEISGQLREALELSRGLGLASGTLGLVIDEALKLGKRVRKSAHLDQGRASLAEIALDHVRRTLAAEPGPVALVGVSAMTERCARELAAEGTELIVANRSLERARRLAEGVGGARPLDLDAFRADPPRVRALVSATGAPGAVLDSEALRRLRERGLALAVDLAVPPDIDPAAARELGLARVGMDEVIAIAEETRQARLAQAAQARALIDEALERLRGRLGARRLDALVAALRGRFEELAVAGAERLLARELRVLDGEEQAAVRRFARGLASKLAHLPTTGLREVVLRHGPDVLDAYIAGAEPRLAEQLRSALAEADAREALRALTANREDEEA